MKNTLDLSHIHVFMVELLAKLKLCNSRKITRARQGKHGCGKCKVKSRQGRSRLVCRQARRNVDKYSSKYKNQKFQIFKTNKVIVDVNISIKTNRTIILYCS